MAVTGFTRVTRALRYWSTVGWNHLPPNRRRSVFVLGHPRSGTNWFCAIASHYLGIPVYGWWLSPLPVLRPVVLHLHRFAVVPARTVYLLRDGRDVAVSYYFKVVSSMPPAVLEQMARHCPEPLRPENARANLPGTIRLMFEGRTVSSVDWAQHLRRARALGLYTVRYEDLLERGEAAVAGAMAHLDGAPADPARVRQALEATSFERQAGRSRGQESADAFHRKGVVGDWRNYFGPEAARLFQRYAGDALVAGGYERDASWVERVGEAAQAEAGP